MIIKALCSTIYCTNARNGGFLGLAENKGADILKTILLVNGTMNFGGAETMIMDIIRTLKDHFRFVFLINRKKGTVPAGVFDDEIKGMEIPIYYIDAVWDVGIKEYERQFKQIVDRIGTVDVVHSHLNSKGGIICRCAYKCGIKRRIVHSHAKIVFDGSLLSRLANSAELHIQRRWIKKYATDFWGCSDEAMLSLFTKKQISSTNACIIHNAINLQKFLSGDKDALRRELNLSQNDVIVGTVGRIAAVKNYNLAADIVKELWRRGVRVHYVVAGAKQHKEPVKYLFDELGCSEYFHYIGERSDTENIYSGLDLYLGTSKREGLGLSVVEAQACGVNCVVSEGFPRICDMNVGLVNFVDSTDPEVWADTIESILEIKKPPASAAVEDAVKKAGFDIKTEANRIKHYYNT